MIQLEKPNSAVSHGRGWVPQKKDSWKAAGFQSLQKAGEIGSSVSEAVYSGSNGVDRLTSQKDKLTESRELFFFLFFFFSWLQPEGHHNIPESIKAVKMISPKPDVDAPN